MDIFATLPFSQWLLLSLGAFFLGLSKAGLKGVEMLNVTIMALVLGGKASTGVVLPLLCLGDVLAVRYYNRHVQWNHFWKLVPWMVLGILAGVFLGKDMDEATFRKIMAAFIILIVVSMVVMEAKKNLSIPGNKLFVGSVGFLSGIATMIGNLAGPLANIYFLAMRLPKNEFIGTAAWFFLVMNFFKLPLQTFVWKNITPHTLLIDLVVLPALIGGFWLGVKIVGMIKDDSYRKLVMILTFIGAVFIFIR